MRIRPFVLVRFALVVVLLAPSVFAQEPASPPENAPGAGPAARPPTAAVRTAIGGNQSPILRAMLDLESVRDAKCHSTACNFEDFVYGSPLTDAARETRTAMQKRLVAVVWGKASEAARRHGEDRVSPARIEPLLADLLQIESTPTGDIQILLADGASIQISGVRLRQYSSIAYALRAILGVRQDAVILGWPRTVTLEPESVEALARIVNIATLCALKLADDRTRERNDAQVSSEVMFQAWQRVLPLLLKEKAKTDAVARSAVEAAMPSGDPLAILRALIEEKIAAYGAYNKIPNKQSIARLLHNIGVFYARYPVPKEQEERRLLLQSYNQTLMLFARQLWQEGQRVAEQKGHRLMRESDAAQAVQTLMPHEIDEFEDVHFFTHLERHERQVIESYDCDSLRDMGIHWRILRGVLKGMDTLSMTADPFAAEVLTEAISDYGVLLLRVAGEHAKGQRLAAKLRPQDVLEARNRIGELARKHHRTVPPPSAPVRLASAGTTDRSDLTASFFDDVTKETGIRFEHRSSKWLSEFRRTRVQSPPTFSGGGVAAEDLNGDGYPDLLLVGGIGNALFMNDGQGRFHDVTDSSGIRFRRPDGFAGEARQPIIADFDNDGRQDILITYANDNHRLYRGLGSMKFEDVTESSGLGGQGQIGGPATVFDFDLDGRLDVYIGNFGDYLSGANVLTKKRDNQNAFPNQLFRNVGGMRFVDVTEGSGTGDTGWTQALSHTDFDRDGWPDIVVANDFGRNALLRNLGNGRFENVAPSLGITKALHSMNVGISDLNDDGFPDIYISNIAMFVKDNVYVLPNETTPLDFELNAMADMLVKESDMLYMSQATSGRLSGYQPFEKIDRGPTTTGWAWDAEFFDFDNDGDDDLYVVNGANEYLVYRQDLIVEKEGQKKHYLFNHDHESNVFFVNENGRLNNRSSASGADFVGNSRSTAYLDFDLDGDLDIAVNNFHAPATFLRNNSETRENHYIRIRLIGDPALNCNRDAIGARILATTDTGLRIHREIQGGSGFLSMNPKEQHFGLGQADSVNLTVVWPSGDTQTIKELDVNAVYVLHQGQDRCIRVDR